MLESELYDREFDDNANSGQGASDSRHGAGEVAQGSSGRSAGAAEPSVPAAVFQPPQVVFQPPAPAQPAAGRAASGSRSRGNGAGSPRDTNADVDAGAGPAGSDGTDGAEGPDGADSAGGRRRRRRSGRGRGRGDGAGDEAAAEDVTEPDAQGAAAEEVAPDGAGGSGQGETRRSRTRSRGRKASAETPAEAAGEPASGTAQAASETAEADEGSGSAETTDGDEAADDAADGTSRRRRRKRRRGSADGTDALAADDPPDTVVHVREPSDDVRSVKGSTRLEAKKQRRREGRETGRRRPPIITESEFLARRESVERTMVVRQQGDRTQIAVLEDNVLVEHYVNRSSHQSYVGNVYLGKVQNVLPSMEAAFVDIGKGRNAVLYAGEVNFDVSGLEGQPKRIESALKAGQSLIVQVTKDPVGHKGARLTSQISLPGRYLVYVPGASMTGISRKLPDTERNRLKQILKKVMPENAGVIVRTAAEGAAEEELSRDVARLAAQWEAIEKKAKTASAPALLYSEPDLTIRVIRDVFNEDFSKLVVEGDEAWDTVDEYVKYVAPHLAERLSRWSPSGGADVFGAYRIDEQLAKALERKVWLPSGGSLVIDKTEAMTVIDVNTGKFTGQGGNLEETVTRNNLEAAEEIVRQLRLRDVGGIVVIDFIDMVLESNRELVLRRLLECLARDRTKHQVAEVTSLGLVQMTRKRVGAGLLEAFSQPCECCNGRGVVIAYEPDGDGRPAPHVHSRSEVHSRSDAHTRPDGGGVGASGNGHAHSSGGPGTNGSGSGSGGNGSGGHGARSGGGSGRSRRGSRGRGGAATTTTSATSAGSATAATPAAGSAAAATPATVAAQVQLPEGTRAQEDHPDSQAQAQPETSQPHSQPDTSRVHHDPDTSQAHSQPDTSQAHHEPDAGPATGELFPASSFGQSGGATGEMTQADGVPVEGARSGGRRRRRKPADTASPASPASSESPDAAGPAEDGAA
jgi:ribonuclease E